MTSHIRHDHSEHQRIHVLSYDELLCNNTKFYQNFKQKLNNWDFNEASDDGEEVNRRKWRKLIKDVV